MICNVSARRRCFIGPSRLPMPSRCFSKSKEHLIRDYFGIETYDKAVVVAGVPTPGQILIPGLQLVGGGIGTPPPTPTGDPKIDDCNRRGGHWINGLCTGALFDGNCPP